jgi:hypothetical protein
MKKYIYAVIKIPLEIINDDNYEPLTEHSTIAFEECPELPPKTVSMSKSRFRDFLNNITGPSAASSLDQANADVVGDAAAPDNHEPDLSEVKLVVLKSDIKKRESNPTNRSFKQRPRANLRRTTRTYE